VNDIRSLLKTAAGRLELSRFVNILHWVALVVGIAALVLVMMDRAPASAFVPWMWVAPTLLGVTLLISVILWARHRLTEQHVALVVDDRLDLREKMSTALACQGRDDAFAQAAIEDAVLVARDARTKERVRRNFGLASPPGWWISPLIVLAAIMLGQLNPLNLFASDDPQQAEITEAKLQAEESIDAVVKAIKEQPELSKELAEALGEVGKQGTDPNAMRTPEDAKREALKQVTDLSKKLDDILNGEKGKTQQALEKNLSQLKTPEEGPAKELAEAMAKGDFSKAQDALQQMMDKLQKGEMKEEDKQKLAEQLQNIAQQLDKLAQQQQALEQALQQAGMDPNLANNPQALQQALQNNQNLNQQQKQQLQQMAQAQQQAAQMCQNMGQACQQMAQACQGGKEGQMGQAGQQMAQQLGDMEALQQLLQQAQNAAKQCQGQCQGLGQGLNMNQAMQQWAKGGMGNRGQGQGGKAPMAPTPTGTKEEMANVNTVEGDIIYKQLFDGEQVRGETKAKLVKVVEAARKGFDEGLTEDQLPRIYHESQKHYFGELEKLTKAIAAEEEAKPAPAEPAKSEEDAAEKSGD